MSLNCLLFISQLTTNFLANYQLTIVFLAKYQLTANPIGTLIQAPVSYTHLTLPTNREV